MKKIVLFILSLSFIFATAYSQEKIAIAGANGIFISLGKDIPNPTATIYKVKSYKIFRKADNAADYTDITAIEGAKDLADFRSAITKYSAKVLNTVKLNDDKTDKLWKIVNRTHREDSLKFAKSVVQVQLAAGTVYLDENIEKGHTYQYRVTSYNGSGGIIKSTESGKISFPALRNFPKAFYENKTIQDKKITVKWKLPLKEDFPYYYKVFRMDEQSKVFEQILPGVTVSSDKKATYYSFTDSIKGGSYFGRYFLSPYDEYGYTGANSDTITVSFYEKKDIPAPDKIKITELRDKGAVKISWKLAHLPILKMVHIYRSTHYDTLFAKIADVDANDSAYIDRQITPMQKYYYYLTSSTWLGEVSFASNKYYAIPASDAKPDKPRNFKGQPVKSGVKLTWRSKDDFVRGYYVYRGNGKDMPMSQISGYLLKKDSITSYTDSSAFIKGSKMYAYAIMSESFSYVKSDMSDTLYIIPGKKTEPMQPFEVDAVVRDTVIKIRWHDMSKMEDKLAGYNVYRRKSGTRDNFVCLNKTLINPQVNSFYDKTALKDVTYEYAVESKDIFGGVSKRSNTVLCKISSPEIASPNGLKYSLTKNGYLLEWNEVMFDDMAGYKIYTYTEGNAPYLLASVDKSANNYELTKLVKGKQTFVYMTAYNKAGKESAASETIVIIK